MLLDPSYLTRIEAAPNRTKFSSAAAERIYGQCFELAHAGEPIEFDRLLLEFDDAETKSMLVSLDEFCQDEERHRGDRELWIQDLLSVGGSPSGRANSAAACSQRRNRIRKMPKPSWLASTNNHGPSNSANTRGEKSELNRTVVAAAWSAWRRELRLVCRQTGSLFMDGQGVWPVTACDRASRKIGHAAAASFVPRTSRTRSAGGAEACCPIST